MDSEYILKVIQSSQKSFVVSSRPFLGPAVGAVTFYVVLDQLLECRGEKGDKCILNQTEIEHLTVF